MRWRVLLFVSLALNLVLGVLWVGSARRLAARQQDLETRESPQNALVKTNVLVRRQFFSWSQVESDDYPTYVANLRDIGCPEQTIRDIIIADVNALYSRRRATEVSTPEQQWWRSEPDPELVQAAAARIRALDDERRGLLARLLGPTWESGDLANIPRPSKPGVVLDGPVLGVLSTETKQAIQDISSRADDRMQAYIESQRALGRNPDPAELARLRQQTRIELASVLPPVQLEEYLLRYSQTANNLRSELGQLRYFDVSPDEFRAMFRATDAIDQQLQLLAGATDASTIGQHNALMQQRELLLKGALGPERYEEYRRLQDPAYRYAVATAQEAGTPEAAPTIYAANLLAAQQQALIRTNPALSPEQKAIEIKRVELEQLKALAQAAGHEITEAPPPPPQPVTRPYIIQPGDTVAVVSAQYGVSISAIKDANPTLDFSRLRPGDTIRVPTFPPVPR